MPLVNAAITTHPSWGSARTPSSESSSPFKSAAAAFSRALLPTLRSLGGETAPTAGLKRMRLLRPVPSASLPGPGPPHPATCGIQPLLVLVDELKGVGSASRRLKALPISPQRCSPQYSHYESQQTLAERI